MKYKRLLKFIVFLLLLIFISPVLLFVLFRPIPPKKIIYGFTFSNKYAESLGLDWKKSYITILDELKPKEIRLVAYWNEIETENNKLDFSNIEWQLIEAQKRDIDVMLAIGKKVPRYPECFEPDWWKDMDETEQTVELLDYLQKTIYKLRVYDNIKIWQVENEPFFPFGVCTPTSFDQLKKEISLVKNLDKRPILVQDSGEGGFWRPSYDSGDLLGISMYRKIWYDFWGFFLGKFIYFQYPLAHWTYSVKAHLARIPMDKIVVTELQAEPWGPGPTQLLTKKEKDKSMSESYFLDTMEYSRKAGFSKYYLWGVEWWLWEKEVNNNPYFWNEAKILIIGKK